MIDASVAKSFPNEDAFLPNSDEEQRSLRFGLDKMLSPHGLTFHVNDEALIVIPRRLHPKIGYVGPEEEHFEPSKMLTLLNRPLPPASSVGAGTGR